MNAFDKVRLLRLTNSRMRSARSCQRRHELEWIRGYRPAEDAEALRFGTLSHVGQQAWWEAAQAHLPQEEWLARGLEAMRAHPSDAFDLARAEAMLIGYHERWKDEPYEVLGVEVSFDAPLLNPDTGAASKTWMLGGTIDAIVRDTRDGRVLVVEHKTSAADITQGSDYWKRLRMDGQVSVYFEGGRSMGLDVAGCLYDVLGKPGLKPLKATPRESRKYKADGSLYANQRDADETPEAYRQRCLEAIAAEPGAYFQRGEVVRLEEEMRQAMRDVWQLAVQLRDSIRAMSFPRNVDSCVQWGGTCPFFAACSGEASLDDPQFFTRRERATTQGAGDATSA